MIFLAEKLAINGRVGIFNKKEAGGNSLASYILYSIILPKVRPNRRPFPFSQADGDV